MWPDDRGVENPYEAPRSSGDGAGGGSGRPPRVYRAYAVYCAIGALSYGGLSLFAAADFLIGLTAEPARRTDPHVLLYVAVVSLAASLIFAAGPFLPRRPWSWTYGLILILVGITVTWPFVAFWFTRTTRRYYGRTPD